MRRHAAEAGACPATPTSTVYEVNPIAAHAPRGNRTLSALATLLIYGGLGTGTVLLGHTQLVDPPTPRTGREVEVILRDPAEVPPLPPPPPTAGPVPSAGGLARPLDLPTPVPVDGVPETPDQLPSRDLSLAGLPRGEGTGTPGVLVPGTDPTGPVAPQGAVGGVRMVELAMSQVRVLHQERPVYPTLARMARIQGLVEVMITVDEAGRPSHVAALSGPPQLHAEAIRCAQAWRFEPARMEGQPVQARFRLTLQFRLQ